jgi:hypothetical protein
MSSTTSRCSTTPSADTALPEILRRWSSSDANFNGSKVSRESGAIHTLHEQIEQSAILMQSLGVKLEKGYPDLGYRGVDQDNPDIEIKHRGKDKRL